MCGSGRTYLAPAQEALQRERCHQKPPENGPASRPRSTSKASTASTKLVTTPHQSPLRPHPYYATAVARPIDTTAGPDRDQPHLLCPPTRAAWAALRGHTIIWHRQTPDRPRASELLARFYPSAGSPSLKRTELQSDRATPASQLQSFSFTAHPPIGGGQVGFGILVDRSWYGGRP